MLLRAYADPTQAKLTKGLEIARFSCEGGPGIAAGP